MKLYSDIWWIQSAILFIDSRTGAKRKEKKAKKKKKIKKQKEDEKSDIEASCAALLRACVRAYLNNREEIIYIRMHHQHCHTNV